MGEKTKIPWCHHTFNPWWGCTKVSAGCENCYAERIAVRYGFKLWGADAQRRTFSKKHWREPLKWNAAAEAAGERRRVFCGSICDVFEMPLVYPLQPTLDGCRAALWLMIERTPWLDWLLLTKRPENMPRLAPRDWADCWPKNVWALATIENQEVADPRIGSLLKIPATIRGLSMEPLLGPGDLLHVPAGFLCPQNPTHTIDVLRGGTWDLRTGHWPSGEPEYVHHSDMPGRINWLIIGCESGPRRRPCKLAWVRDLVAQACAAGVAVFIKQLEIAGRATANPADWPEDLRIQEFPRTSGQWPVASGQ